MSGLNLFFVISFVGATLCGCPDCPGVVPFQNQGGHAGPPLHHAAIVLLWPCRGDPAGWPVYKNLIIFRIDFSSNPQSWY